MSVSRPGVIRTTPAIRTRSAIQELLRGHDAGVKIALNAREDPEALHPGEVGTQDSRAENQNQRVDRPQPAPDLDQQGKLDDRNEDKQRQQNHEYPHLFMLA